MTTLEAVRAALARVRDPEVDRPIEELGFVSGIVLGEDGVEVRLRLPSYFCAPNLTYLMMADAQRAVEAVAGAGRARVSLEGHHESSRLNAAIVQGQRFSEAFDGEATGELDEIRDRLRRKTLLIRQERLCRELDREEADLLTLTVGDLPPSPSRDDYLAIRAELGIDCGPAAPFLVAADGRAVRPERLRAHRRSAAVMTLSFESNGELCQALLAARYDPPGGTR